MNFSAVPIEPEALNPKEIPVTTQSTNRADARLERLRALAKSYEAVGFDVCDGLTDPGYAKEYAQELAAAGRCYAVIEWSPGYKFIYLSPKPADSVLDYLVNGVIGEEFAWEFIPLLVVDLDTGDRLEARPTGYQLLMGIDGPEMALDGFIDARGCRRNVC